MKRSSSIYSLTLVLSVMSFAPALAQPELSTMSRGRSLTPIEVQESLPEYLSAPEFSIVLSYLGDRGLELRLGEINAGLAYHESGDLSLWTIPFGGEGEGIGGYIAVSGDQWLLLDFSRERHEGLGFAFGVEEVRGELSLVPRPELVPQERHVAEFLPEKAFGKATSSCAYIGRIKLYWACLHPSDNPFGYQYDVYYRQGTYNPTSPNWWACAWGNTHVCPNPQTKFQSFPVCGIPARHPLG